MRDPQTAEPFDEEPQIPGYPDSLNETDGRPRRRHTSNNGPIVNTPETRGPVDPRDAPQEDFDYPDDIGIDVI
jgi:hypothetical protein